MNTANIIIMAKREDPFARVSKSMLDDKRLSWRAKGVLAYLLGKPAGWRLQIADVRKRGKEGERAIWTALRELRAIGYASLVQIRDRNRIREWNWKISDSPIFLLGKNAHVQNEDVQNAHHSKKDGSKKDLKKKEAKASEGLSLSLLKAEKAEDSKEEQLKRIPMPSGYPTEWEFLVFLFDSKLEQVIEKRPNLHKELCRHKWHTWSIGLKRWDRIKNWKEFVTGLEANIRRVAWDDRVINLPR